jgi:hypothetical protein
VFLKIVQCSLEALILNPAMFLGHRSVDLWQKLVASGVLAVRGCEKLRGDGGLPPTILKDLRKTKGHSAAKARLAKPRA